MIRQATEADDRYAARVISESFDEYRLGCFWEMLFLPLPGI